MRKAAKYPVPRYDDPHDRRLVQLISHSERAQPGAVNILGVPYDGAVLGRKGAAEGPQSIREALSGFSNYSFELGVGLEKARVFDLGDVVLGTEAVSEAHALVESEVSKSLRDDSLLAILGGDNSISLPALTSFAKEVGEVGLIVIDSHLDMRGRIDGKPTSGSSYGLAIENGVVDPKNVVEIGVHGFLNSEYYVEKALKLGVSLISAEDVHVKGASAVAREALLSASSGTDAVYLSDDIDPVDLSSVAGVSAPSSGGIAPRELFTLVCETARAESVRCSDLVELAPNLDSTGRSQRVAASALTYLIAGYQMRK